MYLGVHAPPVSAPSEARKVRPVTPTTLVIAALSAFVVASELLRPTFSVNPSGRAALDTTITLSAIFTGGLLVANFVRTRRLSDLLLLGALLAVALPDFVYRAAPALTGQVGLESRGNGRLGFELLGALAFAAVALAPRKTVPDPARRLVPVAVVAGAGLLMLQVLVEQLAAGPSGTGPSTGMASAVNHPVALGIDIGAAAVLCLSAVVFWLRPGRGRIEGRLLAGASLLLAGAQLQYLVMPAPATDWVTPGEGLRLAAYALLLAGAYRHYARVRRDTARAAISSERERIARDLHDGLAQDLACIAAQGQRLGAELGPEHPLMIATRHALAASRSAIVDLTASSAPTTEAALRLVADELEHRFDLQVEVRVETDTALSAINDLAPSEREHLVRIAREAIVNAALHGTARHVDVALLRRGRNLLMRVSDDGRGITDAQPSGFGLRTMRARAASLGGRVDARPGADGGTELELLVS